MEEQMDLDQESNTKELTGDKRTSKYWDHFWDIRDPISGKLTNARCRYCNKILSGNTQNGTSNLKKHLSHCAKYPGSNKKQKLISFTRCPQTDSVSMSNWEFDQNAVRLALARMIIVDEEPFSMVQHDGFKYFCSVACPQFVLPSRFTVARDCKNLYVCERSNLKSTFRGLKSRVAITTDCWTSNQNFNYLCLTAHFIDDNWKLHKRILNFQLMDSHKGKEIGKVVEACVLDWGIEDKLSCITVDNASSNDVAVGYLKESLSDKLILAGEFFHMRCAAHVLNLIVQDGLSKVKKSLYSIRGAIRYVRSSPARSKMFDECAKLVKAPSKGSVFLDVSTRWNSTYLMLETAIKFEKAFSRYKQDDSDFENELKDGIPKREDWENAKTLAQCLKEFYEATKRMSGSLYVTANMHFHEVLSVLTSLLEWENDDDANIYDMSYFMRVKFDKYYGEWAKTNMMVLIAVVLDPRYKFKFVKFSLKKLFKLEKEVMNAMYDDILNILRRLYECYARSCNASNDDNHQISSSMSSENNGSMGIIGNEKMKKFYEEFDEEDGGDVVEKCELDLYLEASRERMDDNSFDILKWWSVNSNTYKVLALMAKDVLAIPVSTVSSESAFSTSGRVLDQFRSSLHPKTVETLICAQDWLRGSNICVDIEQFMADLERYEEELDESDITQIDELIGN